MRASDAERESVVRALREHAGEGRLEVAELEQRVASALSARTREELDGLTADLPRPGPSRHARARKPELRSFLGVMAMLLVIWAATGAGYFWPVWPMLGWGLPLLACSLGSRRHELAHLRPGSA
jgi:fatty acid desaturase